MGDDRARLRHSRRTSAGVPARAKAAQPGLRALNAPAAATRLILVCQGGTAATRAVVFPTGDEPLTPHDRAKLGRLRDRLGWHGAALAAPTIASRDTAAALAATVTPDPALRECGYGAWAGRSVAEIEAGWPEAFAHWLDDPEAAPPGGDSLADVVARLHIWLEEAAHHPGTVLAVTPASVLRALVVAALDLPVRLFWRLDAPPLTVSRLSAQGGRWRLAQFSAPA